MRLVVQDDGAAQDGGIGREPSAPEPLADDDRARRAGRVLLGRERPARARSDPERPEDLRRDNRGNQPLGPIAAGQVHRGVPVDAEGFERLLLRGPVLERRPRDRHRPAATRGLVDHHDASDVRIRVRAEHHGVGDAEDRGVRADAECERRDHDDRVPGVEPQRARGVFDVLPERGHECPPCCSEHRGFEGNAALDLREAANEAIDLFRGERRALHVGEVLLHFGEDVDPAGRRHAQGREPGVNGVTPARHSRDPRSG